MKLVMLLESKMNPIPETIKTLENWGYVGITSGEEGDHVYLEGSQEEFKKWLKPFDGVWVGVGTPQFQNFEVMHIK